MNYWNNEGQFQATYDRLKAGWVPGWGACDNEDAEVLRVASNVYYDLYNNGGGNLVDARNDQYQALLEGLKRYEYPVSSADEFVEAVKIMYRGRAEQGTANADRCGRAFDAMMDFVVLNVEMRLKGLDAPLKPKKAAKTAKGRGRASK